LNIINMGTQTDSGWPVETCLDTQWSKVSAPDATTYVICAADASFGSLRAALLKAVEIKANVVSMSLGASESAYAISHLEDIFQDNQNIIFLASSGDDPSVSYPSSSPNVISVGGIILYVKEDGVNTSNGPNRRQDTALYTNVGEEDWYISDGSGSGHGLSQYFTKPSFQATTNSSDWRDTPDLKAPSASPNGNGASIYCSLIGGWSGVQGTSWGAPFLAGLIATINAMRIALGKKPLTRLQIMNALYGLNNPNSPINIMTNGVGSITYRLINFLVNLP
jgi:kumamolisin